MEKCVIYSRVSTDHQDYQRQINELKQYAEGKYIVDDKIFAETVSGYRKKGKSLKERPEFEKMRAYIDKKNIKYVLMWEISRLARNTANALNVIEEFKHKGISIYFYKERLLSTKRDDKLMITFLAELAERERDDIMARVISGKRESASKGTVAGYFGRSIPYGYKSEKKDEKTAGILAIDKEEAEIIQMIFDWAEGKEGLPMSQRKIAKELNSRKIPTRWNKLNRKFINKAGVSSKIEWKPNAISLILRNTTYIGKRKFKDEYFDVPPIIEKEQWKNVQRLIREKHNYKLKSTKYQYLLKGKIRCGNPKCSRTYGCSTELRYNKEQSFYRCYGANDIVIKCKNGQFGGTALDEGVYSLLFQHRGMFQKMKEEARAAVDIKSKKNQLSYYQSELANEQKKLQRVLKNYNRGDYEDAYGVKKARIMYNSDRKEIMRNIDEHELDIKRLSQVIEKYEEKKSENAETFLNEIELYETNDSSKKSDFINKYVDEVVFHKVKSTDIDLKELIWYKVKRKGYFDRIDNAVYLDNDEIKFFLPNGKDNFGFVEIYAFGSPFPVKGIISNHTKLYSYTSDILKIKNGRLSWDNKPNNKKLKQEREKIINAKREMLALQKKLLEKTNKN